MNRCYLVEENPLYHEYLNTETLSELVFPVEERSWCTGSLLVQLVVVVATFFVLFYYRLLEIFYNEEIFHTSPFHVVGVSS